MVARRTFLQGAAIGACSIAAQPWLNSVTFAAAPGDNRLVVVILRGAMDGLDVVQPYGDPLLAKMRPDFPIGPDHGAFDLDGFFALHGEMGALAPLWRAGELGFAHAVSTPYRDRRSHFEGQDMLEAGSGVGALPDQVKDGWLNRLLQTMPGARAETAYSVGGGELRILRGRAQSLSWSPASTFGLSDHGRQLLESVYHDDPLFSASLRAAGEIVAATADDGAAPAGSADASPGVRAAQRLAAFTAARMREETRIAAFSLAGWDTHRQQIGGIRAPAQQLTATILTLKEGLGPEWRRTLVLAMTEFGRTARQNGSQGTDHGTAGAMLMAGGALRGRKVYGRWPGLADGDLYADRDLAPTGDVRAYAGWAIAGLFGTSRGDIADKIFPGVDLGADPRFLA